MNGQDQPQKALDLDGIRERLDLWEEGRQFGLEATGKLGAWSTDSADLLEELEAALALDVSPLLQEVERVTAERDSAWYLAVALEAELATASARETRWLIRIAGQAVNALRPDNDDQYEFALLDVLTWWLEDHQAIPQPEVFTWWRTRLRNWAGQVTEAHERGDTIDESALLGLWERAHE